MFGMGTGGTLQLLSPETIFGCECPRGLHGFSSFRMLGVFRLACFSLSRLTASSFRQLSLADSRPQRASPEDIRTLKTAQDDRESSKPGLRPRFRAPLTLELHQIKPSTD